MIFPRKRNLRVCVDDGLVRSSKDYSLHFCLTMFTEKTTSACLVTPEIEVTILYYSILRIRLLTYSATYRFVPSVVIPCGELKLADVPVPFADPEDPVPASVVTTVERHSSTP